MHRWFLVDAWIFDGPMIDPVMECEIKEKWKMIGCVSRDHASMMLCQLMYPPYGYQNYVPFIIKGEMKIFNP